MADAPIPVEIQRLAAIRAYRNPKYISREVMPVLKVGYRNATYRTAPQGQLFQTPETTLDRKGVVREIEFLGDREPIKLVGYGLADRVPRSDVEEAEDGWDPIGEAGVNLAELLELGREVRVSQIVMNPNTYLPSLQEALTGTDRWSDPNSKPIQDVLTARKEMFVRANIMAMGIEVRDWLGEHPDILERLRRVIPNNGGKVSDQMLATLFEVDKILVGDAHVLISRKGQPEEFVRVWGKSVALLYQDPLMSTSSTRATFGAQFERGSRDISYLDLPKGECGVDGGTKVTVTETVGEHVMAPNLGFLYSTVVD